MSEQQPKPAPKKTKKTKRIPTPKFDEPSVDVAYTHDRTDHELPLGRAYGDALIKVDATDRNDLVRQLVMLAGHVSSTLGDPIESATILVVTKRKKI